MSVPVNITHATKRYSVRTISIANPAAGADWSISVPAGMQWRLRSVRAQLVSSATVANRAVNLSLKDDAGNVIALLPAPAVQAASLTNSYTFAQGASALSVGTSQSAAAPKDMVLGDSYTIASSTGAIQAGDQWSLIWLQVEESSSLS